MFGISCFLGIHYIGEMRNNTLLRGLMDELTNGQLQWNDLDDPFDTVSKTKSFIHTKLLELGNIHFIWSKYCTKKLVLYNVIPPLYFVLRCRAVSRYTKLKSLS